MLEIKTTGVEQYLDGSGNMKLLVIGGPGAGKTRWSSFWPRPFYLDCEDGLASVADRQAPFVRARSSKDMLDALEYLKGLERTPKAQRKYQTVIVDTVDSFQRIVKNEWLEDNRAGVFTGYDAWGYLDSKMGMLLTRLLNLDYNVIVLVHYKEKDNDGTKEYGLQLQGETRNTIFNDFSLVGWLGTYWEAEGGERVQKRGLTFQPTPDKDFLKDRLHVTPRWMPVTLTSDQDYQQLWDAVFSNPAFEQFAESAIVDQVPDSEGKVVEGAVASPEANPGGPVPPRPPVEVPLDKKLKGELLTIAKEQYGLDLPQNTLKNEILAAIEVAKARPATPEPVAPAPPAPTDPGVPAETSTEEAPGGEAGTTTSPEAGTPDPSPSPEVAPADAAAASPESASVDTTSGTPEASPAQPVGDQMTAEQVAGALGGTVIAEETHDTPPVQPPAPPAPAPKAPQGPEVCADCGDDLSAEWNDPAKRDYVRLGFVKHRRYLDEKCRNKANGN